MPHNKTRFCQPTLSGKATLLILLLLLLPLWLSCKPRRTPPPPPQPLVPSAVMSEEGMVFYVWDVKLPGTSQDILLRQAGASTWLPLIQIRQVVFKGQERDGFRPAVITLVSGERTEGDLAVNGLLEGKTDLGSWTIPLKEVRNMTLEHY